MKILIITPYGEFNYGNKFQNYALQTVLERMGHEVETITNENWYSNSKTDNMRLFRKIKSKISNLKIGKRVKIREKRFEQFSNKYIKKCVFDKKTEYDFLCIGSDQIWNPNYSNKFYYTYGQFSDKVFSYAASFGVSEIAKEWEDDIKIGLKGLRSISVREATGAQIVKRLIDIEPEVHLDPTMLLDAEEWDKITRKPENFKERKYIFTYFLGNPSQKNLEKINEIAETKKMEIVNLGQSGSEKYYLSDPGEFLYLLKNSEMVFTDSFHGCVFSILYKKNFYVTQREASIDMFSRINTLFEKFNIKSRKIEDCNNFENCDIDFVKNDEILKIEREKSIQYIENALKR